MSPEQLNLPFNDLRNQALLSSHWLENRLHLEPEWVELRDEAQTAFLSIVELWKIQRERVAHYGAEQPLEEAFIQPVFEQLGWEVATAAGINILRSINFLHDKPTAKTRVSRFARLAH